jgi:hypothetical protein
MLEYDETLARRVVNPEAVFCKPAMMHMTGLEAFTASTGERNSICKMPVLEL